MTSELMQAVESFGRSLGVWDDGTITVDAPVTATATVTVSTCRRENDEWVCLTCTRRWGVDEDRPACERNCGP